MSKVVITWNDKGHETSLVAQKIMTLYKPCIPSMISNLDKKNPDPKHPGKLKDDSGLTGGVTAAHFYHRTSDGHVYVPCIDKNLPVPLFWHWVTCATIQDPAAVVSEMLIVMCLKMKPNPYNIYAHEFMVKYKMSTGASYDNAVARAWSLQIQTNMQADPTYTSKTGYDLIQTLTQPAVRGRSGVAQVSGVRMTPSKANGGKQLSIGCLLLFVLLLCILSTVIGHMFMWEATSFVLSKVHPGGVFSSASAMHKTLTGRPVNLLVYEGPGEGGCHAELPTKAEHFTKFHDLFTTTDNRNRVLGVVLQGDSVKATEANFQDVLEKDTVRLLDLSISQYSRQCTAHLLDRLANVNADCFYQCVLEYADTSILKTVCSKILKGASDKMMRFFAGMVTLWSAFGVASKAKPTTEDVTTEASKWTLAYLYSLYTGDHWYTAIFQLHTDKNFMLSTVSEEDFLQNMLMLAKCHENPATLCVVCILSLCLFWQMVVYSTTHSTTFKEITVGSAAFFKDTANSWHHTDLFDNKKGAITTGQQSQTRACVFFIHLVYLLGLSLCKSMHAYAATWNAFCQIVMIPAWSLFLAVSFLNSVGVLTAVAHGRVAHAMSGILGSLKASSEVLDGLAQTTSSVVQSVSLVMMAGQGFSAIVSPSIDVFFYAHYCGLWCNALLALHVGIDSAVTVFTRALSAYVAYQTCLGVANIAVVLACAAAVCYVRTRCGYKGKNGVLHAEGNNLIVFTCMMTLLVVVVRVLLGAVLSKQTALVVTFRAYDMFLGGFVVQLGCGEVLAQWVLSMVLQWQ